MPVADLPYLGDVARLELAWREAYHAAEAVPLDPARLAAVAAADQPFLCFSLHPSLRLVRAKWPVLAVWEANLSPTDPVAPLVLDDRAEDILVLRPHEAVEVRRLPPGGAEFIDALGRGEDLAAAAGAAQAAAVGFDLTQMLNGLFEAEALTGFGIGSAAPGQRP